MCPDPGPNPRQQQVVAAFKAGRLLPREIDSGGCECEGELDLTGFHDVVPGQIAFAEARGLGGHSWSSATTVG